MNLIISSLFSFLTPANFISFFMLFFSQTPQNPREIQRADKLRLRESNTLHHHIGNCYRNYR